MKACGLIVEYNPYHNGHHYHFQEAKRATQAECMVAIMSGNFLQRGEPAIIDKFSRAKIAAKQGIDLVVELPYFYAVQHSEIFAKGAIHLLHHLNVDTVCFGSEHGRIDDFKNMYEWINAHQTAYNEKLTEELDQGLAYPKAHEQALVHIGGDQLTLDATQPNNILGYQYVKNIYDHQAAIKPYTISRVKNHYHDQELNNPIASATSIRRYLLQNYHGKVETAIPKETWTTLHNYQHKHGTWHDWQAYFHLLKYRLLTMKPKELANIHGMKEGLEHRMLQTVKYADNFHEWMSLMKTKRYTWTSLQRLFTHLLTNTQTSEIEAWLEKAETLPIVRVLAMNDQGRAYLRSIKKQTDISWYTSNKAPYPYQTLDDRVDAAYYSILPNASQQLLSQQSYQKPFII
ncbi:nucleotidyltransferase [Gracilibacillus timonensis]|uniref:nucleotidyltransferase n=1 Tax=Gracilibacillus timonensis TaxID=1816696 RepID=UPI000824FB1E|nr:nucleotidyltransferase [Gracilibacillus timonensis]